VLEFMGGAAVFVLPSVGALIAAQFSSVSGENPCSTSA
jgi:hypothetical protein